MPDLDLKHRPKTFKQVIGQPEAVSILKGLFKKGFPHKVVFHGPSGCGKTTMARICAKKLDCDLDFDFTEINCADFRGIDDIRKIRQTMGLAPMAGKCRIYLLDETHKLTGDAQTAMLKIIEEPPDHVYFILATTDFHKMIRTIQTRLTPIPIQALSSDHMHDLLHNLNVAEGEPVHDDDVMQKIMEIADGSARQAVKLFESVMGIKDDKEQINALQRQDTKRKGIDIARILFKFRPNWRQVVKLLRELDDDPEKVRHIILIYANAVILGNPKLAPRAAEVIELFRDAWYDCGKSGLYASCFQACQRQ